MPKYKNVYALKSANDYDIGELTIKGYDSTSDNVFNKDQLAKLYSALSGGEGDTLQAVEDYISTSTNSTTYGNAKPAELPKFRTATDLYNDNDGQNIVVQLFGQEFAVSFLTTDNNGHVIATLWMTQPLKQGSTIVQSTFGWANAAYATSYTTTIGESYISNAYSTSNLRMLVLNGGDVDGGDTYYAWNTTNANATVLDQVVESDLRKSNVLAPYTLNNSALEGTDYAKKSLVDYIVQPKDVEYTYHVDWPYTSGSKTSYILNDALSKKDGVFTLSTAQGKSTVTKFDGEATNGTYAYNWWNQGVYNYANSDVNHYNDWGEDYVWLPAVAETGNATVKGLWGTGLTATGQVKFGAESLSANSAVVLPANSDYTEYVWFRSGRHISPFHSQYLAAAGNNGISFSSATLAVRPALHLDLTAADGATATVVTTPNNATVKTEYNGAEQTLKTIASDTSWYDNTLYTSNGVTVSQSSFTDAGTYKVTVTLNSSDYVWSDKATNSAVSREFTVIVEKKKLAIKYEEDENGYLVAKFEDEDEIYSRDTGDKYPNLITKYYEDGDSTDTAKELTSEGLKMGDWRALAVITNDCNYEVSDSTKTSDSSFPVSKKQLSAPYLTSDDSETYSGSEKQFAFDGYDGDIMDYEITVGADSAEFDGEYLTATNVGTYTIKFKLTDADMYEWTDSAAATVTVKINPKSVNLTCADLPETWEKGEEISFSVTTVKVADEDLALTVKYTRSGVTTTLNSNSVVNNGDGTYTVTLPKTLAKGSYTLNVATAEGGNYSGTLAEQTFTVTAEGYDFDESDIVWTINGKDYTADSLNDDGVLEIEYAGKEITVKVNELYLDELVIADDDGYDGDTSATDVGEYELTVHIVSGSDDYAFDGYFTLNYKIVAKELSFDDVVWQYSYDGDEWINFTATNKPEFTGDQIQVRISPTYLTSLGLADGDYTINYNSTDVGTAQNDYTTTALVTILNKNYTTANGNSIDLEPLDWSIAPKSLAYEWSGTQTIEAGDNAFEIPAVKFGDGGDHSKYYTYYFTIANEEGEFTAEELAEYIAENWSENTPVSGTVIVRMNEGETEVNIKESSYPFSTGSPKIAIVTDIRGSGSEYGKVNFVFTAFRDENKDERERTEVTVSGTAYSGETVEQTFDGTSSELAEFVNKLGAGNYVITLALTGTNGNSYALSQYSFVFEISKCRIELPTVPEIIYNGSEQSLENLLIGYNADLMELSGITSQTRHGTNSATVTLLDTDNYEFVRTTTAGGATTVKYSLADEEEETESVESIGGSYDFDWTIEKFVITQDMWDLSGKSGASIKLPSEFNALLADESALKFTYSYYTEQNGQPLEEGSYSFKGGNSFFVSAELSGSEADNFVFENGTLTSDKTVYAVPQSAVAAFMSKTLDYVKNNLALVIGCAIGLLLLILLIIIIAAAVKRKKRRDAEKKEEKKLEREERMMRMQMGGGMPAGAQMPMTAAGMIAAQQAQTQQPMPQPQPVQPTYQQPVQQPQIAQTPAPQTYDGGAIARIEAELAAIREEQKNKTEAELANARLLVEFERLRGDMKQLGGAVNFNGQQSGVHNAAIPADVVIALLEAVKNGNVAPVTITNAPAPAAIPQSVEESAAQPVMAQYPSDAVITTTTTVDTTQKPTRKVERENKRGAKSERSEFSDIDGFYDNADY